MNVNLLERVFSERPKSHSTEMVSSGWIEPVSSGFCAGKES